MRHGLLLSVMACFTLAAVCDSAEPPPKKTWYEKAVSKLEAKFDPAEAKPGQTVTFTLTVELTPGYTTYPTAQVDPMAAGMVNTFKFPDAGDVVFVGDVADPAGFKTKAEPEVGVKEIRYYEGKVVFERKAVVSPSAKPGERSVTIPSFRLSVCDDKNCFPPKALMPEAKLKVLDGPPVAVDPKYADEVKKASGGM